MVNVCYFEIPVDDMGRAQEFYAALFNWRFEPVPETPEACDYWQINTGNPEADGLAMGGIMKRQDPNHMVTQYMGVDSVETFLQKAQALGALMLVPKTAVPGKGYFAICLDLDRNPFGLWECDPTAESC